MGRDGQGSSFGRGTVGNLAGSSPPGSTTALPHHTEIARDERDQPTDLELVPALVHCVDTRFYLRRSFMVTSAYVLWIVIIMST